MGGGGVKVLTHDHDTLEFAPRSMVKFQVDHLCHENLDLDNGHGQNLVKV